MARKVNYLTIVWVKAHAGTVGNERADQLAKEGAQGEVVRGGVLIPMTEIKGIIREKYRRVWDGEWSDYKEAKHSKRFFKGQNKGLSKLITKKGRYNVNLLCRIITGHNALNWFRNKVNPVEFSSICRFCLEDDETFWHLCTDCPVFRCAREDAFFDKGLRNFEWKPDELLDFANNNKIAWALEGYDED